MNLNGLTAMITGGGSGLGEATARVFAQAGMTVSILDFDLDKARQVANEIGGIAVRADVGDAAQVEAAVKKTSQEIGAARVVVNCAGIGIAARIIGRENKLSVDKFEQVIRVNLIGTYNVMSYALREMMALEPLEDGARGVIINTASAAYQDGQLGQAAYAASKGGIASMCLPAARELALHGVRVCVIAPGLFHTPMMETLSEEIRAGIISNIPYPHRLGNAQEFGALAKHIVENQYLNGEVIRLDGATRLPPR